MPFLIYLVYTLTIIAGAGSLFLVFFVHWGFFLLFCAIIAVGETAIDYLNWRD